MRRYRTKLYREIRWLITWLSIAGITLWVGKLMTMDTEQLLRALLTSTATGL